MPSILPDYEYDIFISYRHNDNRSGWVTEFVKALEEELAATIKESLSIYFDKNPHDGLQQHHEVDESLKEKLKSLMLIPIVSQTYCDPKSFAWAHELIPFIQQANGDSLGLKTKVSGGNIASRVLPIRIHDLDNSDKRLFEEATGSVMRPIDFVYKESGVNRPLRPTDDRNTNQEQIDYRNQVNKVANAIKEIISGVQKKPVNSRLLETNIATAPEISSTPNVKKTRTFGLPKIRGANAYKLLAIIMLVAFVIMTIVHITAQAPDVQQYKATLLPPELTQFTTNNGGQVALSPDGQALAFIATDSTGKNFLWVRQLNSKTAQLLAGTEGATSPFWSPDGLDIAFFAGGKLKKMPSSGGTSTVLCDAQAGRGGSWNSDGDIIFCPSIYPSPLFRIQASGGTPLALTQLDTAEHHQSHRWPTFLPDGRHFLFSARTAVGLNGDNDAIYLGSMDATFTPRVVARAGSSVAYANGYLLYTIEAALLAQPFDLRNFKTNGSPITIADKVHYEALSGKANFSVSKNGVLVYGTQGAKQPELIWYNRNGQAANGPSVSGVHLASFKISPDQSQMVGSLSDEKTKNTDIWMYLFDRNLLTRFTFDANPEWSPIWSPDGSMIVYSSPRKNGISDLFKRSSNGESSEIPILVDLTNKFPTDWSRDGRFIMYNGQQNDSISEIGRDIWVLPMEGKGPGKPYPFLQTTFGESNAVFSPDGKWVAYESNESGTGEVYIRPFPGPGGKWQVSTNSGDNPRWRNDGKELFYNQSRGGVYAVEVNTKGSYVELGKEHQLFFYNVFGVTSDPFEVVDNGELFLVRTSGASIMTTLTLEINWPEGLKKN